MNRKTTKYRDFMSDMEIKIKLINWFQIDIYGFPYGQP